MPVWVYKYVRTNYESRQGHMEQPIDKYYSIAFELGSKHKQITNPDGGIVETI